MSRGLIAVGIALAAALILGGIDRRSAEVTAANERSAAEKKADVRPEVRARLMHPLGCPWIAKCSAGQICKAVYTCSADLTKRGKQ